MNRVEARTNAAGNIEKRWRDPFTGEWSPWLEML